MMSNAAWWSNFHCVRHGIITSGSQRIFRSPQSFSNEVKVQYSHYTQPQLLGLIDAQTTITIFFAEEPLKRLCLLKPGIILQLNNLLHYNHENTQAFSCARPSHMGVGSQHTHRSGVVHPSYQTKEF